MAIIINVDQSGTITLSTSDITLAQMNLKDGEFIVELPNNNGADLVGKCWKNGQLVDDPDELYRIASIDVRDQRNKHLTDYVDPIAGNALRFSLLSPEKKAEWIKYRDDLLNVPQQEGFPYNVVWPIKPE